LNGVLLTGRLIRIVVDGLRMHMEFHRLVIGFLVSLREHSRESGVLCFIEKDEQGAC
jgi:hypothetical protein